MNVKRHVLFEVEYHDLVTGERTVSTKMVEFPDGQWVSYEDYKKLYEQKEKLFETVTDFLRNVK